MFPQAYHIIWGTYGTRLHGTHKPHVDRNHNVYGTPFSPTDPKREETARERMTGEPVRLILDERKIVEDSIHDVSLRYGWKIHAIAIQSDHAHVVITAAREGTALRDAIKAVGPRALNKRFGKRVWWAEGGSAKYLWERSYFVNAMEYVTRQRDF